MPSKTLWSTPVGLSAVLIRYGSSEARNTAFATRPDPCRARYRATSPVPNEELFDRLARVFRVAGFEGASLGALADGAGLQRASLYHRFPDGKVQMAEAVMGRVRALFTRALEPMTGDPDVTAGVVESGR